MTPVGRYSWGEVLIRASYGYILPSYVELRGQPHLEPRNFRTLQLPKELPKQVQATIPDFLDTSYWKVDIQEGQINWISEITELEWRTHMGQVFDEDNEFKLDELADDLIDKCELDLRTPDNFRFNGVSDAQWDEIKSLAHERINGRA